MVDLERRRIGLGVAADLAAGRDLAAPVALALSAGLSGFLWLSVEPLHGAGTGRQPTLGPVAYAAWLLAVAGWVALPRRYARWPVALAIGATVAVLPATALTGAARPPLWVVFALVGFGALGLAAPPPRSVTARAAVITGVLLTAALGKALLTGYLPVMRWSEGYYRPTMALSGLVAAGAVAGLAAGAVPAVLRRQPVRPWLWGALLLALPGGWLGPRTMNDLGTGPGFGRLAEVLLATCVVGAAMAALSGARSQAGLDRAGGVALGCAAGLAAFLWVVGEDPGSGWGPTRGPWAYAGWLVAALAWPVLPVPGRRAVVGLALGATVVVAGTDGRPRGAVLVTLALLGIVALLGASGRARYPLLVFAATVAGCAVVARYDNGWRLAGWADFWHTSGLVVTLAIVPFALAAVAGMRALAAGSRRGPAVVALVTGGGWIGVLPLPHLPAWGPVPLLVALIAAGVAALLAVRTGRARATARRALAEGRHAALSSLAGRLGADPLAVLCEGYRQGEVDAGSLRARLVHAALRQPAPDPADAGDPLAAAVSRLPAVQRVALVLRYDAELPVSEIAVLLGASPPAVRALLDDARSALLRA
ncbi:MAG: hypothetical protein AUI10_03125 [Actinobacteria bacterium 13_2_20CM_2_72_6]|nr:MAG: hypothetical protein AUI10_03125 [Actinobacteria bacterium 13_2_20CM_2_72_6]